MSGAAPRPVERVVGVDVIALALHALLAIVPLGALFTGHDALVLGAGSVVIATGLNLVMRRISTWPTVLVGCLTFAAYVTFVVFEVGRPEPSALHEVWIGATGSWADLLTAPVPADPAPRVVAFPVLLAWLGAEVATLLALRTRWITWPVVAPLAALVVALLYSGDHVRPDFLLVAVVVVLVLTVVLVRANTEERPTAGASASRLRTGVILIGVVAIVATAVGLTAPVTSAVERTDLHDRYRPPFDLSESVSPLSQVRAGLEDDDTEPLFTVQFDDVPDGISVDHVDVATLGTYDGTVWGTDASFGLAGRQLPADPDEPGPTVAVGQHYELSSTYRSPFLPSFGRPSTLRAEAAGFDRVTGMLVRSPGQETGRRYDLTALVALPGEGGQTRRAGAGPDLTTLTAAPPDGWPVELTELVAERMGGGEPRAALDDLEAEMRGDRFGYSVDSRPGHSLKVLVDFLTASAGGDGVEPARIGYAEQFASAFAVLARIMGHPSRVVVGYHVDPAAAASGDPVEVRASDITAWPEVYLQRSGWVRFNPTKEEPREPIEDPPPPPTTATTGEVTETTVGPSDTVAPTGVATGGSGRRSGGASLGALVALAVAVAAIVSIPLSKWMLRRRRQTHGTATDRTRGAWRQTRDLLRTHGVAVSPAETVQELADRSDESLAGSLQAFAPIVDELLYAAGEPTGDVATTAWELEAEVATVIGSEFGVRTRAKAVFDPRPLAEAVRRR